MEAVMTSIINDSEEPVCRNCHEPGGDLIAPCHCSGSIKWVHRECLDMWRTVSSNPLSMHFCDVCKFKYKLKHKSKNMCWPTTKCILLSTRDIGIVVIAVAAVMMAFGFMMWGIDTATNFTAYIFPTDWLPSIQRMWVEVWMFGPALLFFILGIGGSFFFLYKSCCGSNSHETHHHETEYSYDTYPYYHRPFYGGFWMWYVLWNPYAFYPAPMCYCPACTGGGCSGGDCDVNGDGAGKVMLIILLIVILIIVIIGFIIGMILFVMFFTHVVRKHVVHLKKSEDTKVLEVVDLSKPYSEGELEDVMIIQEPYIKPLIPSTGPKSVF
ncbi:hypothetical protein Pelo_12054 [Pelomyxa schiedti]|nr:hypothetical protein Pelo_12054 [Pelomyxa schiedti]